MEPVYQKRANLYLPNWLGSGSHENDVLFIHSYMTIYYIVHEEDEEDEEKEKKNKRENSSGRTFRKSQASNICFEIRIMRNVCKVNEQKRSKEFKFLSYKITTR